MLDFSKIVKATRGSALYYDAEGEKCEKLEEIFRFICDNGDSNSRIQEISLYGKDFKASWRNVRALPSNEDFFENVWRTYRENKNVY